MKTLAAVLKIALIAGFILSLLAQLYLNGVTVTIGKGDVNIINDFIFITPIPMVFVFAAIVMKHMSCS